MCGIHRSPVNSPHKWPVTRKMFPFDDVIMPWSKLCFSMSGMQWASYQIRKIAGCACAGNAGNVFPRRRIQRKMRVSDPGMHHGTCVTHVPWCMSGLLTRGGGENVPGIPGACAPATLRIWQEAHGDYNCMLCLLYRFCFICFIVLYVTILLCFNVPDIWVWIDPFMSIKLLLLL